MRILVAHNFYQQPGGEDQVFADEVALLRQHGHEVEAFIVHNDQIEGMGALRLIGKSIWNREMHDRMAEAATKFQAEVVHFHNTFPLMSPACFDAAKRAGAAVVQTLHNFRLLCVNALLYRDGSPCERCVGSAVPWQGVAHGCYRGSRTASAGVAAILTVHRTRGTWLSDVDLHITPSEFARRKFIAGGLPRDRVVVKPNFLVRNPEPGRGAGGYAAFVGRLSPEKGVGVLLEAWRRFAPPWPLRIIGDGPMASDVKAAEGGRVEWLGRRSPDEVLRIVADAAVLVVPSVCYETFGRAAIEAMAVGTPVIASGHGPLAEIVEDHRTGRLFTPGDARSLASAVEELWRDPAGVRAMRHAARRAFELRYTADANYRQLMDIYERAAAIARQRNRHTHNHDGRSHHNQLGRWRGSGLAPG